jgi:hypothetical protein
MSETFEFSLSVGCRVSCLKYCPQEMVLRTYGGNRFLSLRFFKYLLGKIPKNVTLYISGVADPLYCPDALDIIEYAHSQDYKIKLSTTLDGISREDALRLNRIKFEQLAIHCPDANDNAHIRISDAYKNARISFELNQPNLSYVIMNNSFKTCERENLLRGKSKRRTFLGWCLKREVPNFFMMPDGDVFVCCMGFGVKGKIGNLFVDSYQTLKKRWKGKDFDVCHYCSQDESYFLHFLRMVRKALSVRTGV